MIYILGCSVGSSKNPIMLFYIQYSLTYLGVKTVPTRFLSMNSIPEVKIENIFEKLSTANQYRSELNLVNTKKTIIQQLKIQFAFELSTKCS